LIVSLFLFTSSAFAGLTYPREKLKGTTKTQGDFNLTNNNGQKKCQCKDGKCPCAPGKATQTPKAKMGK